jgi:hypothetical protein
MNHPSIPKLIVVDGLSASGKTTTCRWLEQLLQQYGVPTRGIYEADIPHPLHWWDYWDGARHHGPDFDRVSPADYIESSIEKWTQFVDSVRQSDEIVIVEGPLYCLAVWMFLQGDTAPQQIAEYIDRVEAIVQPIAPLLVYLRQDDVAAHTRHVWNRRDGAVKQELIANMERTPYLRHRHLRGFDGVIALWQATQALTDELFASHRLDKLAIEVTQGNWEDYYAQIRDAVIPDRQS